MRTQYVAPMPCVASRHKLELMPPGRKKGSFGKKKRDALALLALSDTAPVPEEQANTKTNGASSSSVQADWSKELTKDLLQLRVTEYGKVFASSKSTAQRAKYWNKISLALNLKHNKKLTSNSVQDKYKRLKKLYASCVQDLSTTGNSGTLKSDQTPLWDVLLDSFGNKQGLGTNFGESESNAALDEFEWNQSDALRTDTDALMSENLEEKSNARNEVDAIDLVDYEEALLEEEEEEDLPEEEDANGLLDDIEDIDTSNKSRKAEVDKEIKDQRKKRGAKPSDSVISELRDFGATMSMAIDKIVCSVSSADTGALRKIQETQDAIAKAHKESTERQNEMNHAMLENQKQIFEMLRGFKNK
jgi:hypothetical protein